MRRFGPTGMFACGIAAAVVLVALVPSERAPVQRPPSPSAEDAGGAASRSGASGEAPRGSARGGDGVRGSDGGRRAARPQGAYAQAPTGVTSAELERMAAGYRGRIFLRAIREHGHRCDDVVEMQVGRADFVVWRVTCGSGRAYFVDVDAAGEIAVEPLYYGDPIGPGGPPRTFPEDDGGLVPRSD